MGGESRNTFFTLHWKDGVVLCCIPAGNHRASTRQKHLTAHGAAALMATKYLFTELCFSVSTIPWGHCGVGASLGQPRHVLGNVQRCWSGTHSSVPSVQTHSMARAPQKPPFTFGSLFFCLLEDSPDCSLFRCLEDKAGLALLPLCCSLFNSIPSQHFADTDVTHLNTSDTPSPL